MSHNQSGLTLEACTKLLLELANSNPVDDRRNNCIHCWEEFEHSDENESTDFYSWYDASCIWVRTRKFLVGTGQFAEANHSHFENNQTYPACAEALGDILPIVSGVVICAGCMESIADLDKRNEHE